VDGDGSNTTAGPGGSGSTSGEQPNPNEPPDLRGQIGATIEAIRRLIGAHIDLAKAELGEIVDEVKRTVALAGLAFGAFVIMAMFLTFGLALFLGEWLFGSLGWGVLLGAALLFDLAMVALLLALDVPGRRIGSSFLAAFLIGLVVGVLFGLGLARGGWVAIRDNAVPTLDPIVLAIIIVPVFLGVIGFVIGLRHGTTRAVTNLVGGVLIGVLLGLITSINLPQNAGAAVGVLVWLIAWPIIAGRDVIRHGIDTEALQKKFIPQTTIDVTKETIEWVRARTPLVPKS
jgi:hypothetical protein